MGRRCNYERKQLEEVGVLINNHLITNMLKSDEHDCVPYIQGLAERSGFYSLVAIEYINEDSIEDFNHDYLNKILKCILHTYEHKSFPLIMIHDEFKAHANNMNKVRQTYIDILAEIAESNMLEFVLNQFRKVPVKIEKYSQDLADLIREAEYPLS